MCLCGGAIRSRSSARDVERFDRTGSEISVVANLRISEVLCDVANATTKSLLAR